MRARDLMTTPPITIDPDATVKQAATLLVAHGVSALPVVEEGVGLVGVVSEADLMVLETEPDPTSHILPAPVRHEPVARTVRDVMTTAVITTDELADVALVARLMIDHHLKSVPVVMGTEVVGVIARRDVLRVLARTDREIQQEVTRRLLEEVEVIGRVRAEVREGVATLHGCMDDLGRRLAPLLARSVPGVIDVRLAVESA